MPRERQTASRYRQQAGEISFICERQHYLSLSPKVFAASWRRCVKSCQSFLDGGGTTSGPQEGADQRILPTEPDWPGRAEGTGAELDPVGRQPRWTRGCPAERPLPGPHSALRVASLEAAGPGSAGTAWPLAVLVPPLLGSFEPLAGVPFAFPASRRGPRPHDYRPPPGQEPSACGGGGSLVVGASELWRGGIGGGGASSPSAWGGLWVRPSGGCPSADLSWVWGSPSRGVRGRDSRCGPPAVGGIPWRPVVRNTVIHLGYLGGPESLTRHLLFFKVGWDLN